MSSDDSAEKRSEKTESFKRAVVELCREHRLSIAHEDTEGAFLIERYDERNIEWFMNALPRLSDSEGRPERDAV